MAKIVIVNGRERSGKDTFVNFCLEELKGFGKNISTVDFVKKVAIFCGWDGTKSPKNRKFLSDLKDLLTEWNEVPYNKITEEINIFNIMLESYDMDPDRGVIFIMCREPEEIQKFVDRLGATTVCIRRKEAENLEASNHADAEVLNYEYDYYIDNNYTLEDLRKAAINFLKLF